MPSHLAAVPASTLIALRRPGPATVFFSCRRPLPPLLRARAVGGRTDTRAEEEQATFYDLLGISSEGTFQDVRAAYRRMARSYHPDVSPPDAAKDNTRRFIQLHEAYQTLSDPDRRQSYDRALARGLCHCLAFSASSRQRRPSSLHQHQEEKSGWRRSWEGQITELKKRSTGKDSEEKLSWGARMRRRRAEASPGEQL